MIRKRIVFAVFVGAMTMLSGAILSGAALVYYTGFLDGTKQCQAGKLK
jgi:hypothetical protein